MDNDEQTIKELEAKLNNANQNNIALNRQIKDKEVNDKLREQIKDELKNKEKRDKIALRALVYASLTICAFSLALIAYSIGNLKSTIDNNQKGISYIANELKQLNEARN